MKNIKMLLLPFSVLIAIIFLNSIDITPNYYDPNVYVEYSKNIFINADNVTVEFDSRSDKIFLSDKLEINQNNDTLIINEKKNSSGENIKIIIGTMQKYNLISINVSNLFLKGFLEVDQLNITASNLSLNCEVKSDIFNLDVFKVDFIGTYQIKEIFINSFSILGDLNVIETYNLRLNTFKIELNMRYLDSWKNTRDISLNSFGGKFVILTSEKNEGFLKISSSGFSKIIEEKY